MKNIRLLYIIIALVIFVGCSKEDEKKDNQGNTNKEGFIITKNQEDLSKRLTLKDDDLELEELGDTTVLRSAKEKTDTFGYSFTLRAEVLPPVYKGDTLQASHIVIYDNFAFVTYNTQGEKYLGGIELFDVSNIDNPVILWSALLPEGDLSAVDYLNQKVYLAGALNMDYNDYDLNRPAFLSIVSLNDKMEIDKLDTVLNLYAYTGTDVRVEDDRIYATSGSDGYFKTFDFNYNELFSAQLDNARSVDYIYNYVCVFQGMPGRIKKYDKNTFDLYYNFDMGDANIPGSKSDICVTDNYIIAALNEGGVKAINYHGQVQFVIPKPETPVGKITENYVSNSVSVNDKLLLIANGGAGIYVAHFCCNTVKLKGTIQFEDRTSVNFVESKGSILFAATGKGGLKIVEMKSK